MLENDRIYELLAQRKATLAKIQFLLERIETIISQKLPLLESTQQLEQQWKMSSILETIIDGVMVFDREWRILSINQRGAEILGQQPQLLVGRSIWDIYPEAVNLPVFREYHRAIEQQCPVVFQEFYAPLNVWFEVHAYPSQDGLVALYQDITARKQEELRIQQTCTTLQRQVEERTQSMVRLSRELDTQTLQRQQLETALKATNEQLAQIFESITDGFCELNRQWQYTYVNQTAEQLLQKNRAHLLGQTIWEAMPQLVNTEFYQTCFQVRETETAARLEFFYPELNAWFQHNIYPSAKGITIYFQDITDRKRLEAERNQLLQQEQAARMQAELAEQRAVFLHEASAVLASSLDYNRTLAHVAQQTIPVLADYCLIHKLEDNGQLQPIVTVHRDSQQQAIVSDLGHYCKTSVQHSLCFLARVLQTGSAQLVEEWTEAFARSNLQDEGLRELYRQLNTQSVIVLPLKVQERVVGTLLLALANSQRRYTEADFSLATDLAQRAAVAIDHAQVHQSALEAHRMKDEFLMALSHELRSPLNAILGWANILRNQRLDERVVKQALETIERKARVQTQIVYDLLTTAQIVTGRMQLNLAWIDLASIVEGAIASLRVAIETKSIQLEVGFNSSIGPLRGDPKYLQHVVWSLLSNAIKFTPEGGRISIDLSRVENRAQLKIQDTGYGIESNFLPYIFERFRQSDGSINRQYSGLGLGLALVRHLVELHGGTIEAESAGVGQGATFTVLLPMPSDRPVSIQDLTQQPPAETEVQPVLGELHLLVTEPDRDEQEILAVVLEGYGAAVTTAASVEEALTALNQFQFDILVIDIDLPGIDLLMRQVHLQEAEHNRNLPVVALTASHREKLSASAQLLGIHHSVSKPINPVELASTVSAALASIE